MSLSPNSGNVEITIGVEEELFLIDPESRDLVANPDPGIFEACGAASGEGQVVREFLRSQIETNTAVHRSMGALREDLAASRKLVIEAARDHGAAVMAASAHPFAAWEAQLPTPKERYREFASTYQETVRRLVICGMHIHAGFGDLDTRIRVMTALRRYLPLFIGLSASSPFGEGRESGFKCNRLNLFEAMPRTSVPGPLHSGAEFDALVNEYRRMHFIADGSQLWWDIRPSHKFPTIELRVCDTCTAVEDALCVAALYSCLIRMLARQDRQGALPAEPPTEIIVENKWLAQRYGLVAFLGDTRRGGRIDIADALQALLDELADDARALDCQPELDRCLTLVREGSSADRQLDLFRLRLLEGATREQALRDVVDLLVSETAAL